ncbi:hypothetical protein JK207_16245 [Gluconobacter cerinus]|uniref:hypothetical protein n=1 Tax=Gluconobacter cerinus TaxID=38307 RepID=UPI001B8B0C45|nr:hypothetical protein [Gluconobacter cerinus]MBS1023535.1 hypothetical protein [Gluconobacter cerinus]
MLKMNLKYKELSLFLIKILLLSICIVQLCSTSYSNDYLSKISLTKKTDNFEIKNSFPIFSPQKKIFIKNISGEISTITRINNKFIAGSELLFSVIYSESNKCPKYNEHELSYADIENKYNGITLFTGIVKQNFFGKKVFRFSYNFEPNFFIPSKKNNCIFLTFDGTDFSNVPYTISSNMKINYDFIGKESKQKIIPLDGEMIISVNNLKSPTLNGYIVHPVGVDGLLSGKSISYLNGNTSISAEKNTTIYKKNSWNIRHIISIYKNNLCSKAFPNHINSRFTWNDYTGYGIIKNKSSIFDKDSIIIAESNYSNKFGLSQEKQVLPKSNIFPIKLNNGDCVVDAIIPSGNMDFSFNFNTESQLHIQLR